MVAFETIWERIEQHKEQEFHQIQGQSFTYEIIHGAVVPSTTNQQLAKSQFKKAAKFLPLESTVPVQHLRGPSYLFAILMDPRIRQGDW